MDSIRPEVKWCSAKKPDMALIHSLNTNTYASEN